MKTAQANQLKEWAMYAPVGDEFVYMQSGTFYLNNTFPRRSELETFATARELSERGTVMLFQRKTSQPGYFDYVAVRCSQRAQDFVARITGDVK